MKKDKVIFITFCVLGTVAMTLSVMISIFNILFPFAYKDIIVKSCDETELDYSLVASIIFCESRYNKKALSKKGAVGLMQIMPATAESFYTSEDEFNIDILYNPKTNIQIGCSYLRYLFDKYDNELMVIACYNAGEGTVRSWLKDGEPLQKTQIRYQETLNYVEKVLKYKKFYKNRFV